MDKVRTSDQGFWLNLFRADYKKKLIALLLLVLQTQSISMLSTYESCLSFSVWTFRASNIYCILLYTIGQDLNDQVIIFFQNIFICTIMLVKVIYWWMYQVGENIMLQGWYTMMVKVSCWHLSESCWWTCHLNTPTAFFERSDVPIDRTVTRHLSGNSTKI